MTTNQSIDEKENIDYPWVTFMVMDKLYCISSKYVSQMVQVEKYHQIPNAPDYANVFFELHGEFLTVINLRKLLGIISIEEEFSFFEVVKQQHIDWVNALEDSVKNNIPFTKETNPCKCAFGKWFYSYKNDDRYIQMILKKIEQPHAELHKNAVLINDTEDNEKKREYFSKASCLCNNILVPLISELSETALMTKRGMIIVVETEKLKFGVLVDAIRTIEKFKDVENKENIDEIADIKLVSNILLNGDNKVHLEIDVTQLAEYIDDDNA